MSLPSRSSRRASGGLTVAPRRPTVWGVMRTIGVAVALEVALLVSSFAAAAHASTLLDYVTFDGIDYIPASEATPKPESSKSIVILQRGWVFIGDLSKDGEEFTLSNAQNIQRWGTTDGLGQLALSGPTNSTQLKPAGTVRFHELTVVARLDVDVSKW